MKDSNFRTPRTLSECQWTPGYVMPPSRDERFKDAMKGIALAFVIGLALAAVLFFELSK